MPSVRHAGPRPATRRTLPHLPSATDLTEPLLSDHPTPTTPRPRDQPTRLAPARRTNPSLDDLPCRDGPAQVRAYPRDVPHSAVPGLRLATDQRRPYRSESRQTHATSRPVPCPTERHSLPRPSTPCHETSHTVPYLLSRLTTPGLSRATCLAFSALPSATYRTAPAPLRATSTSLPAPGRRTNPSLVDIPPPVSPHHDDVPHRATRQPLPLLPRATRRAGPPRAYPHDVTSCCKPRLATRRFTLRHSCATSRPMPTHHSATHQVVLCRSSLCDEPRPAKPRHTTYPSIHRRQTKPDQSHATYHAESTLSRATSHSGSPQSLPVRRAFPHLPGPALLDWPSRATPSRSTPLDIRHIGAQLDPGAWCWHHGLTTVQRNQETEPSVED